MKDLLLIYQLRYSFITNATNITILLAGRVERKY